MRHPALLLIITALAAYSCQSSTANFQSNGSAGESGEALEEGKPVIALMPVRFDAKEPVAQTLGEAYSATISDLLESMQTYDVRPIPEDFTEEDLVNRGYDNIISADVTLQDKGTLNLNATVHDARTGENLVQLKESTSDYLALFSTAESMVFSMVEEFYGGHIGFARLKIRGKADYSLFIDELYRKTDEEGIVPVLAGKHEILLMDAENHILNFSTVQHFEEGEEITMSTYSQSVSMIYPGRELDIRIDGDPADWTGRYMEEEDRPGVNNEEDPSMDLEWVRFSADKKNLYGIIKLGDSFSTRPARITVHFTLLDAYGNSSLTFQRMDDGSMEVWEYARGQGVDSSSGRVALRGDYLEFSCSIDVLQLSRDQSMKMWVRSFFGENSDRSQAVDEIILSDHMMLLEDPTPMLLWRNRNWEPGTATAASVFSVMDNLIEIDRSPMDWAELPIISQVNGSTEKGSLLLAKSAMDSRTFYLFLQSEGKWDRKRSLRFELDGGDGRTRELIIDGRKVSLVLDGTVSEIGGELRNGANYLEAALPLSELGGSPEFLNLMRVVQEGGNELKVLPYY